MSKLAFYLATLCVVLKGLDVKQKCGCGGGENVKSRYFPLSAQVALVA